MIEQTSAVVGYHGTSRAQLPRLLAGDIDLRTRSYDWLGAGLYFWQDMPWRAQEWADERYGTDAAVVVSRISLDRCVDLLNPHWQRVVAEADRQYVEDCYLADRQPPSNRGGNRARDCATVNWYCDRIAARGGTVFSVRAIFQEGEPIFPESQIYSRSHVQVAVRDPRVILEIEELT